MRPHPKIRKTVKWGGAAVSALLLVAWIGSVWCSVSWYSPRADFVGVCWGCVSVGQFQYAIAPGASGLNCCLVLPQRLDWWVTTFRDRAKWAIYLPLWPPLALSALATVAACCLDFLARRRAKLGACLKCNYSRTGLAPNTVCPECGSAAESAADQHR